MFGERHVDQQTAKCAHLQVQARMAGLRGVTLDHDISSFCREGLQAHAANIPLPSQFKRLLSSSV